MKKSMKRLGVLAAAVLFAGAAVLCEGAGFSMNGNDVQPILPTGEYWEAKLGPGNYVLGIDIPLGVIDLYAVSGRGWVRSSDGMLNFEMDAGDDLFEFEEYEPGGYEEFDSMSVFEAPESGSDEPLPDLRNAESDAAAVLAQTDVLTYSEMESLLAGTTVTGTRSEYCGVGFDPGVTITLSGALVVRISASDSNVSGMNRRQIDGDPVTLGPGTYTGGEDIPAGTYSISAVDGIGEITADDGSICEMMGYPGEDGINSETYMNYSLREGTKLTVDGLTVSLQRMKE